MEPRGPELIRRYKAYFGIAEGADIPEEKVLAHWKMEKELRRELLESTPETRWDIFERAYTRLYAELAWLMPLIGAGKPSPWPAKFRRFVDLIGPPPKTVYEIGSGKGELIAHVASKGFVCRATEVTRERGERQTAASSPNLSWGVSDGVHLDRFEPPGTYDVVTSDQVIEHLHPDDLAAHLSSARRLLKTGGRYVLSTPHPYSGPHEISRVFGIEDLMGLHLKEYTYRELVEAVRHAGFQKVYFAFIPGALRRLFSILRIGRLGRSDRVGAWYLGWLLAAEKVLSVFPRGAMRRGAAGALRKLYLFTYDVSLVAEKGDSQ